MTDMHLPQQTAIKTTWNILRIMNDWVAGEIVMISTSDFLSDAENPYIMTKILYTANLCRASVLDSTVLHRSV